MSEFKAQNVKADETCSAQDNLEPLRLFPKNVNSAYVWTKSGVFKLATFVRTKRAKQVFQTLLQAYFDNLPIEENSLVSVEENFDEVSLAQFERLEKFVANCAFIKDENLREKLIKVAAKFLIR